MAELDHLSQLLRPWAVAAGIFTCSPSTCADCKLVCPRRLQESEAGARKRVNQLFKADFFGEGALLSDEPR